MPYNRLKQLLTIEPEPLSPTCLDKSGKIRWLGDNNKGFTQDCVPEITFLKVGDVCLLQKQIGGSCKAKLEEVAEWSMVNLEESERP